MVPSARMAPAIPMAACTMTGCMMLGRMWRARMRAIAGSEGAGGLHVFALAGGQDLGADQAGVADPSADDEGENQIPEAGTEEGDEGDGQQDSGERQKAFITMTLMKRSRRPP